MVCSGVRLHLVLFFEIYTLLFIVFFTDLGLLLTRLEPGSDPNQNSEFNWTVEHQDLISDLQLDCCTTADFAHAGGVGWFQHQRPERKAKTFTGALNNDGDTSWRRIQWRGATMLAPWKGNVAPMRQPPVDRCSIGLVGHAPAGKSPAR